MTGAPGVGRAVARALPGALAAALLACGAGTAGGPTVTAGDARFQFLTPSLVRMEYSPSGVFVDAPDGGGAEKGLAAGQVRTTRKDGWLIADTRRDDVRYRLQSGTVCRRQSRGELATAPAGRAPWHPGDNDPQNLGGLPYSLDNVSRTICRRAALGPRQRPVNDVIPGIDVRAAGGAARLAEPHRLRVHRRQPDAGLERAANLDRAAAAAAKAQDWYLFTYIATTQQVLQEYAQLCGPIPMIPRYVLGPW